MKHDSSIGDFEELLGVKEPGYFSEVFSISRGNDFHPCSKCGHPTKWIDTQLQRWVCSEQCQIDLLDIALLTRQREMEPFYSTGIGDDFDE